MQHFPTSPYNTRLGFHYFPDTDHYRESDLRTWLPELRALGATWLTLQTPSDRAIPEAFLRGLIAEGIEPILHFQFNERGGRTPQVHSLEETDFLFSSYARWGVHYVVLFDRPNLRSSWSSEAWAQSDLVERFLDSYQPLAEAAARNGLIPVFPPLEPGGDYWDTAFLRAALQALERRNHSSLAEKLVLSAYARAGNRPLNWGSGGPERWPGARPYFTPAGVENQRGFRIFDWYLTIAEAVTGAPCPIFLFAAGSYPEVDAETISGSLRLDAVAHAQRNLIIAQTLLNGTLDSANLPAEPLDPIPPQVLACNFWLLTAAADSPYISHAWIRPDGQRLPIVDALRQWMSEVRASARTSERVGAPALTSAEHSGMPRSQPRPAASHGPVGSSTSDFSRSMKSSSSGQATCPIGHYLLLPAYEWGVSDWHLDVIRPYVKKYRPTIGFSLEEAGYARRVTVVGGLNEFSEEALEGLRSMGCIVERINGNGTSIATRLAT